MRCKITKRKECRLCGSREVRQFVCFPDMPFTDELVSAERIGQEFRADLPVYWCADCHAAQTQHDVEVQGYYRDYQYTVSASMFARRFMNRLAEAVFRRWNLRPGTRVVEIGSGDGYQLSCFQRLGADVMGFEPSAELTKMAGAIGVPTVQTLFNCQGAEQIPPAMRPADVILLTYTFDHLPDPRSFLDLVKDVLDSDRGLLVIEVHDFEKIVERREICLLEHEHTIYMTRSVLRRFLESAGFKVVADDLLPAAECRGNSLLIVASMTSAKYPETVTTVSPLECELKEWQRVRRFSEEITSGITRFREYLREKQEAGQIICGYGAGGRGVMTLAMTGARETCLRFLSDQNSAFHGLYTPVTHIPIKPADYANKTRCDEMIVFSYAYMDEIRKELLGFQERGGRLISMLNIM